MENTMDDVRQRVGDNFEQLREELSERTQEIRDTVGNYVDAHPLAAVGIAFGVGYLLSGALFSRTTFKVASIGGRIAFGGLLKQLVVGIGPGMLLAALGDRGRGAEQSQQEQEQEQQSGGNGNRNV